MALIDDNRAATRDGKPKSYNEALDLFQSFSDSPWNTSRKKRHNLLAYRSTKIICIKDIPQDNDVPPIIQLCSDDAETIAAFLGIEKDSERLNVLQKLFGNGCECYALFNNDIIALTWVYRIRYQIGDSRKVLEFRPGEALISGTVWDDVIENERRLRFAVANFLKLQGIKPLVFVDKDSNEKPVYTIRQLKIMGLTVTRIKSNPDFSPLSFS